MGQFHFVSIQWQFVPCGMLNDLLYETIHRVSNFKSNYCFIILTVFDESILLTFKK